MSVMLMQMIEEHVRVPAVDRASTVVQTYERQPLAGRDIKEIDRCLVRRIGDGDEIEPPLTDSKVDAIAQAVDNMNFGAAIDGHSPD